MYNIDFLFAAEADYMIKDEETEKKYNFVLADALKRARRNAGKLFAGITFYVTSKVPVETKLLKNVVTANGGQVRSVPCSHIPRHLTDRTVVHPESHSSHNGGAREPLRHLLS